MNEPSSIKISTYRKTLVIIKLLSILTSVFISLAQAQEKENNDIQTSQRLLVMTEAESPYNDEAFQRFNRSVESYELNLEILENNIREVSNEKNRAYRKLELFEKALASHRSETDLIVMLVDGENLIINAGSKEILKRFSKLNAKILFAADSVCWPDSELRQKYPPNSSPLKYLSSQALIGHASDLWELINSLKNDSNNNSDDLQSRFTDVYLSSNRTKFGIELDHRAELFQPLHSTEEDDVELEYNFDSVKLKNSVHQTEPVIAFASDAVAGSNIALNSLGNYLGKAWTLKDGCRHCNSTKISLDHIKDSDLPTVLIGIFIEEPTPFMEDFFDKVADLNYTKSKIDLFIHNPIEYHDKHVDSFLKKYGPQYASHQLSNSHDIQPMLEWQARNFALNKCKQLNCDHYFALDSIARLDANDTLKVLIEANETIVAPLLTRPKKLWSNFWGSITKEGFYIRSHDYVDIVSENRVGLWNVPHVMNAYLIRGEFIRKNLHDDNEVVPDLRLKPAKLNYLDDSFVPPAKPILAFTRNLRLANVFQYLLNSQEFGHLIDPTTYNTSYTYPDLYQLIENMHDWEEKYLHDNFSEVLEDHTKLEQPCQDVFWFPLVNDRFCSELIEIMENFGQWSGGTSDDPRIEGGYESVPTRDIHFKQVGLHDMWLAFLKEYVMPVQLKEYIGYEHDPPRTDLAFVVRYHPSEQDSLRPHHDSSTYTLNIALNVPGIDYEGGGCKFVRYNCSVTESRRGWALIHPGKLTHYHEGLRVTNGTRYILVTFIDP